ncbi:hypothetical protein BD626DRAFT_568646 [Schizophyllum amplum]|uniref:Ribosomal L28 family-domain-containing protein n=1 Tax=Schizophyllum amplum TaxID=97359 RepID=A0A550CGW4_9AGAR|nr:hypothetical protein BD626DRAFT_568646 [Auriculariopsis ampla]
MRPTASLAAVKAVSQPFMRAQEGLFHGKSKRYGNNVPHSLQKTRRTWLPNIRSKTMHSEALGLMKLKITTTAIRATKKMGGLDEYVLRTPTRKLGELGIGLRIRVRETRKEIEQANAEAARAQGQSVSAEERMEEQAKALGDLAFLPAPRQPTLAEMRAERERAGQALGLGRPAPALLLAKTDAAQESTA